MDQYGCRYHWGLHGRKRYRWMATAQDTTEILSAKNARVKEAHRLLTRRQRDKTGKILLEGQRLIHDAVDAGVKPLEVYFTHEAVEKNVRVQELLDKLPFDMTKRFVVSDAVIRALSDTVTPQVCIFFLYFSFDVFCSHLVIVVMT